MTVGAGGAATSWTGIGAVVGGAAVLHGADVAGAGLNQLITGEETQTFTQRGISKGLKNVGMAADHADKVAGNADASVSVLLSGGSGYLKNSANASYVASRPMLKVIQQTDVSQVATSKLDGSFSIWNWEGYPSSIPKPKGPFNLIEGEAYSIARKVANKTNAAISRKLKLLGTRVDIHELNPVKFGGSPTNINNKLFTDRTLHQTMVTPFWKMIMNGIAN